MGFDANGSYTRIRGSDAWKGDAQVGTKIMAPLHDDNDNDLANALSDCLNRKGKGAVLANISWGGFKITNLAAPTEANDAATKAYADSTKASATGLIISGADANGRLSFTSATGLNGLSFTGADMCWVARIGAPSRFELNAKADGTGAVPAWIDRNGAMGLSSSLSAGGTITAGSSIIGGSVIAARSGANAHFWFYGPSSEDRGVIYTNAGIVDGITIRNAIGHSWSFDNNGQLHSPGGVYAGAAALGTDGNTHGSIWTNWGYNDAYTAISAQIEARASAHGQAWANDRVANLQYRKVSQVYDTAAHVVAPAGAVLTGYSRVSGGTGQVYGVYYMYLQVYDPVRGWVGFSG